jgi:thiamine-monophosphate kinase
MSDNNDENSNGIGRYDFIDLLSQTTGLKRQSTAFGTNTVSSSKGLLLSHELMLEGTDFNLVYFPLRHLGYKLVIRTIAGIYASGGIPEALTVTAGMSTRFGKSQAGELLDGVKLAADKYKVGVKFFDLLPSVTGLTLSCSAWGNAVERAVADLKPSVKDLICVTGDLGSAYTGLQVLERERRIFEGSAGAQPELSEYEYIISRQLRPDLKIGLLEMIRNKGIETSAMTVVREGLATELLGLCHENKKGCRVYYDKLPVDQETHRCATEMNSDPVVAALNGGDDFEFLFFAPIGMVKAINNIKDIRMIGYLTDESEGCYLVTPEDEVVELRAQGWKE